MESSNRKIFGSWLRDRRKEAGLTLSQVSEHLNNKTKGTISNVESGITPLPIEKINPIARLYKLEINEILGMLRKYEPELFNKYVTLEQDILREFTDKIMRGSMGKTWTKAMHHRPFPAGMGAETPKLTRIYIIRHWLTFKKLLKPFGQRADNIGKGFCFPNATLPDTY